MDREQLFESGLLEMYVLGLTSPEETQLIEDMVKEDPTIQKEIDGLHKALETYASQHAIPPPPGLKRKVLRRVDNLAELESAAAPAAIYQNRGFFNLAIAASMLFFLTSGFLFFQNRSIQKKIASVYKENYNLIQSCEAEREAFAEKEKVFALLNDVNTKPHQLIGSPVSPQSTAIVYWNETDHKVLMSTQGMPAPPEGKQYQVWADVEGEMINMGLIDPENQGMQEMKYIAQAESVNITLEPKGGSEHPTVALLYANVYL